jgi:hypothetical protein
MAQDLYVSDLFSKARAYAESNAATWYILSAKFGAIHPQTVIHPYDLTLDTMGADERDAWAVRVLAQLDDVLQSGDTALFLAGKRYREGLIAALKQRGVHVEVPMAGLPIGSQLQWLSRSQGTSQASRAAIDAFYRLVDQMAARSGMMTLAETVERKDVPERGVYFFLDRREPRGRGSGDLRVVRVGTHGLIAGTRSTILGRLRQHRGQPGRGGNHRGSIFRLHVGAAILARTGVRVPTWGGKLPSGQVPGADEFDLERRVSRYLADLLVVTLPILDEHSPNSLRGYVERNSIALLTTAVEAGSVPSADWLGHHAQRDAIRTSGLWNVTHVGDAVEEGFLDRLSEIVEPSVKTVGGLAAAPPIDGRRTPASAGRSASRSRPVAAARTASRPRAADFARELEEWLSSASRSGHQYLDVRSGDLHRKVGGYPGTNHAMPVCCNVMRRVMRAGDEELQAPPQGLGASVVIRYVLPR